MSYKMIGKRGEWLVQVQRKGIRKTKRGTGGESEAKRVEALITAEIDEELRLKEAAEVLGVKHLPTKGVVNGLQRSSTLRDFFEARWLDHAKVVQNPQTRRTSRTPFNYLLHYLGDKTLEELLRPVEINAFIENMKETGPIAFFKRSDGNPRRRKCSELSNATINKSLQCLQALLNLAHSEEVISSPPRVDMLPTDDSRPVLPPSEDDFEILLTTCKEFRKVAPWLPEVAEFVSETGLRRGEIFHLTWGSVDLPREAIRVEMQSKGRLVNGRPWKPKHNKWREVPLSKRAKEILEQLTKHVPTSPEDFVFPNKGGAPYDRMDRDPNAEGKGFFPDAVRAADLTGKVTFHGLRHLFAVRLLTSGVAISVVSEILGHSDVNLTVKRYGRFASDAKIKWDAVRVLDRPSNTPDLKAPQPKSDGRSSRTSISTETPAWN